MATRSPPPGHHCNTGLILTLAGLALTMSACGPLGIISLNLVPRHYDHEYRSGSRPRHPDGKVLSGSNHKLGHLVSLPSRFSAVLAGRHFHCGYGPPPGGPPATAVAGCAWSRLPGCARSGTNSFATNQQGLEIVIPGVPALPAPPSIDDPNLANDQLTWSTAEALWAKQDQTASAAASAGESTWRRRPARPSALEYERYLGLHGRPGGIRGKWPGSSDGTGL